MEWRLPYLIWLEKEKKKGPYHVQRHVFPCGRLSSRTTSSLIKSMCLYHRTCSEEGSMPRRLSSGIWRISTSGIANCPSGRYTIWQRAAAKPRWATFLPGWRRAWKFTAAPRSGHLKPVASSTERQGEPFGNLEVWKMRKWLYLDSIIYEPLRIFPPPQFYVGRQVHRNRTL